MLFHCVYISKMLDIIPSRREVYKLTTKDKIKIEQLARIRITARQIHRVYFPQYSIEEIQKVIDDALPPSGPTTTGITMPPQNLKQDAIGFGVKRPSMTTVRGHLLPPEYAKRTEADSNDSTITYKIVKKNKNINLRSKR